MKKKEEEEGNDEFMVFDLFDRVHGRGRERKEKKEEK